VDTKEKELEEFKESLRELVVYTLPEEARKDKDVVDNYLDSFLLACEEFKRITE
jgi:hypothetical protein